MGNDARDRKFGRYRVRRELGKGAMGSVLLAHDEFLGRDVAIKTIAPPPGRAGSDALRARFTHEARAIATLNHPNVVNVFDAGVEGDTPYLVMEVVSGPSLKARLAEGPLWPWEVCALGIQMAQALAEAHAAGIVHRDVKPANIMQFKADQWKLGDFGVARIPDSSLTLTGQFLGTPAYAAPETITEGEFSPHSDVYALAATLFEAAAGAPPFPRSPQLRVAAIASGEGPAALADIAPHAPDDLGEALARGLAASPSERPSASEFAESLAVVSARTAPESPPRAEPAGQATEFVASAADERPAADARAQNAAEAAGAPGVADSPAAATGAPDAAHSPTAAPSAHGPADFPAAAPGALATPETDATIPDPAAGGERGAREAPARPRRAGRGVAAWAAGILAVGGGAIAAVALGILPGQESDPPGADPAPERPERAAGAADEDDAPVGAESAEGETAAASPREAEAKPAPAGAEEDDRGADRGDSSADEIAEETAAPDDESAEEPSTAPSADTEIPELEEARSRVEAGRSDQATLGMLENLASEHPEVADIPYLKGRLYFSRMWWSQGFENFEDAVELDSSYRRDEGLIADLIEALKGSRRGRARRFLEREIGEPAIPQLREAAERRDSLRIRENSRAILQSLGAR